MYHLLDRAIGVKHQKDIWGNRLWSEERAFAVLVARGDVSICRNKKTKLFEYALAAREITPDHLTELLYSQDPKSVKPLDLKHRAHSVDRTSSFPLAALVRILLKLLK